MINGSVVNVKKKIRMVKLKMKTKNKNYITKEQEAFLYGFSLCLIIISSTVLLTALISKLI